MPEQNEETSLYDDLVSSKPPVQQRPLFGSGRKDKQKSLDDEAVEPPAPETAKMPSAIPPQAEAMKLPAVPTPERPPGSGGAPGHAAKNKSGGTSPREKPSSGAGYIGGSTHRYADGTTAKRKTVLLRPDQELSLKRYCAENEGASITSVVQSLLDAAGFYGGKVPETLQ